MAIAFLDGGRCFHCQQCTVAIAPLDFSDGVRNIPVNVAIAESAGHGQSIFEYAPKTKGASAFKALAGPGWYRCLANKLHHPLCAIGRSPSAKGDRSR